MTVPNHEALLDEYIEAAVIWDSLVGGDAKEANRIFDRLHAIAKELRRTQDGREGLVNLISHDLAGVRLLSATECLAWSPAVAVRALEETESSVGLHAISAKYTLKSYRAGTLNLDW